MAKKTRVAIVKVDEYDNMDKAVAAALDLIEAGKYIDSKDTVLFKPNLLMKIKNACTEPDFLASVARYVRPYSANMQLGDSPGQFRHRAKSIIQSIGMDAVMQSEGIEYKEFEAGGVLIENPDARHMKKCHIAKPIIDADCIINLCRPKSHMEAGYTGAIKNYWGIIPGGEKASCHLYGRNPVEFGTVLADNYQTFLRFGKKRIVVMDARKFMEGPGGPGNGYMRRVGLILAGYDEAAIDMVMLAIGRIDGVKAIPHLKSCRERGLGVTNMNDIEIRGKSIESVRFRRKAGITSTAAASVVNNYLMRAFLFRYMRRMPAFAGKADCVMCGDCFNICPNKAISWQKNEKPVFHWEQCISCLCCVECCPQQALKTKPAGFSGLFMKIPEVKLPS